MYFKLEYTVREFPVHIDEDDSLRMVYGGPHRVDVSLRLPTPDERNAGYARDTIVCTARSEQELSLDIRAMFECLAHDRLPAGSEVPAGHPHFDREGRLKDNYAVPLEVLPERFRSLSAQVRGELEDHLKQTINVMRWRHALRGPHNPFSFRSMDWSFDGRLWRPMPHTLKGFLESFSYLRVSENVRDEVVNLVMAGTTEPLAHSLYREAWQERHQNPRSALVVGIAAAEIGVKQCISALVPDAQWLVENAPSPPLVEMLRRYFPQLPVKCMVDGKVLAPPEDILETLKKGVSIRNKLVHVRPPRFTYETLEEVLLAVQDVLWISDHYVGFEWAWDHIRTETQEDMESH